ncbi:MAG: glycosyltransferase family 2 protein [Chloroflexi bacterium]|nr:glycosyltransferase family 2 protein [Chloroflexota bacterium]
MRKGILAIMPAFNEENNISSVLADIHTIAPDIDVLVVDDGSKDKTRIVARENGAYVLRLSINMGYGAALQAGYKYALKNKYNAIVQLDADGQHDPADIPTMLEKLNNDHVDVVIGSRFMEKKTYKGPLGRRLVIGMFRLIAKIITGKTITDPTSGYQVLNSRAVNFLKDSMPTDFPDTDTIILLLLSGFTIGEIPAHMRPRSSGTPMVTGFRSIYYLYKISLSILVTLLRRNKKQ